MKKKINIKGINEETYVPDISHSEQISLLNQSYLEEKKDKTNIIYREINKKINGYKNQDIKKQIYNEKKLITMEETMEKLVISKLKCHYCLQNTHILYTRNRDETQWTLDRIDNNLCHSNENTVIACLKCNLQRRCQDAKKFTFTKQLRIAKMD